MNVPRNMLKELLERKLWPIALVLVIALVAVPVLLTKKAATDIVTPPTGPLPYWGWGEIPDQYGRRTSDDDGETPLAPDPEWRDLPPLRPYWGPRAR